MPEIAGNKPPLTRFTHIETEKGEKKGRRKEGLKKLQEAIKIG